jgi:hypothetical protein
MVEERFFITVVMVNNQRGWQGWAPYELQVSQKKRAAVTGMNLNVSSEYALDVS